MQRAADSTIVVVTEMPHLFSGAKQLATLSGLPGGLDGHYPIWASDRRKSQTRFSTKLPQLDECTWQAVQQAVADGGVFVRWVACASKGVKACGMVRQLHNVFADQHCWLREWPELAAHSCMPSVCRRVLQPRRSCSRQTD